MPLVPLGLSVEQATEEIVKLEDEIQFHQSQLVLIRWHQGRVVYHMDKSYGTGAVDKLSERTGVHRNTLKLAERLYEHFDGDESQFRAWLGSKKRHWYHVEGLLRAGSDPEALGRDAYIERLKRRIERLAMDLDELNTMAEDDEEASGVTQAAVEEVQRFKEVAMTRMLASDPRHLTPRSDQYLDFIRSRPCVVCGGRAEPHHVSQGGAGMKGSDFSSVPLCREHHNETEERGHVWLEETYGIRIGSAIADHLHIYFLGVSAFLPKEVRSPTRRLQSPSQ